MTDQAVSQEPPYEVSFGDGARAQAVAFAAGVLHLVCDRAHPPGRPLTFSVALPDASCALEGKSAGSKRRADGLFDVRVRLSSVRREQRELLARCLDPAQH